MKNIEDYRRIYRAILDRLEASRADRNELITAALRCFELSEEELNNKDTNGRANKLRSLSGTVINEMHARGVIAKDGELLYRKSTEKPIAIRMEKCEEQILRVLREGKKTKNEIKDLLTGIFGTDTTSTRKDDDRLYTFIGQILKSLITEGLVDFDGSLYSIAPARVAVIQNREALLSLKFDFLNLIHSKGGEFFEHYFMNLLSKYLVRSGKLVTESHVMGGAADGGIDGIVKTVDSLGFRETVMVQTKNRREAAIETEVRAFYGAVCAAQGTRGIFAVTSDFHPMAKKLLDSIDNCVGINGDRIFAMAADCEYGLRTTNGQLILDREALE